MLSSYMGARLIHLNLHEEFMEIKVKIIVKTRMKYMHKEPGSLGWIFKRRVKK